jgi:fermentation-respiration switch protein FrsA (DUF1100 family)
MDDRFKQMPASLAKCSRVVRLGPRQIPALLAHPDWETPCPTLIWMHGRTADKFLDSGRYLRLIRAGIAACAVDLPGHGERLDLALQGPTRTPEVLNQMVGEVDHVFEALGGDEFGGCFDLDRAALGGMSAGGMVTLRRLCDQHPFVCACVESTAGNLAMLYDPARGWPVEHVTDLVPTLDPITHLSGWRPIPLLALHSQADRTVPLACIESFTDELRGRYEQLGADAGLVRVHTWPTTGAPDEHNGFGRVASEAKTIQVDFLTEHLRARPIAEI